MTKLTLLIYRMSADCFHQKVNLAFLQVLHLLHKRALLLTGNSILSFVTYLFSYFCSSYYSCALSFVRLHVVYVSQSLVTRKVVLRVSDQVTNRPLVSWTLNALNSNEQPQLRTTKALIRLCGLIGALFLRIEAFSRVLKLTFFTSYSLKNIFTYCPNDSVILTILLRQCSF